ncbi:hypothetical protein THRCLA_06326 [Thraustotheca clavata]|uniref:Uncharacterized protein n=1 Tax=Thraustotheca clavata TaxID=74557 RepID=A0A1V9ZPQ7_9STRA|nr:hypothetical protein THRCLA_06326 [Thraustotheca clavata]
MEDDERELAKWNRRIEENRKIRASGLLDEANLLVYSMQKLSHKTTGLNLLDRYYIWSLVKKGYEINERDDTVRSYGIPPMVHAATRGWLMLTHLFVSNSGDVNYTSSIQESPISAACRRQHMTVIRYLAQRGANLNICDKSGFSCLRWACKHQDTSMLKLLLRYGASVTMDCGTTQLSALDWAREYDNITMVSLLEEQLVKEKKVTLTKLEAKHNEELALKKAKKKSKKLATEAAVINDHQLETTVTVRQRRARERIEQQQRQRIENHEQHTKAAFEARAKEVLTKISPVEHEVFSLPVEKEWYKVKSMHWQERSKQVKVDPEFETLSRLKRVMELSHSAMDEFATEPTPTHPPKALSVNFYFPKHSS